MAVLYRSIVETDITVATASPVVTKPAGVVTGDMMLMFVATNTGANVSAVAGWTLCGAEVDNGTDSTTALLWKIAAADEPSTWTMTNMFAATETADFIVIAYSGVSAVHKIGTEASLGVTSPGTLSGPSVTPTVDGCMIVQFAGCDPGTGAYAGTPDTNPVGVQRWDAKNAANDNAEYIFIQEYRQGAAGAIALDVTDLATDTYGYHQVALSPNPLSETASLIEAEVDLAKNGIHLYSKTFTETATVSHNVLNLAGIILLEAISLSDPTVTVSRTKGLTETVSLTDSCSRVRTSARILTESITCTDSIRKETARNRTESITASDSLTLSRTAARTFSETATLSSAIQRGPGRAFSSTLTCTDTLRTSFGWKYPDTLTLNGGSITSGVLSNLWKDDDTNLVLAEVQAASPGFAYDFTFGTDVAVPGPRLDIVIKGWYAGNPAHDIKIKQWRYSDESWIDVTAASNDMPSGSSEQVYEFPLINSPNHISNGQVKVRITQAITGVGTHTLNLDQMYLEWNELDVSEAVTLTDTRQLGTARVLADGVTAADSILKGTGRSTVESATLTDSLEKGAARTFSEATTLSDVLNLGPQLNLSESVTLSDEVSRATERSLTETAILSDPEVGAQKGGGAKTFDGTETLTLDHQVLNLAGIILLESITPEDTASRSSAIVLKERAVLAVEPVQWTSVVNVTVGDDGSLTKTSGSEATWDATAISTQSFSKDCFIEVTARYGNQEVLGFSSYNTSPALTSIEIGVLFFENSWSITERGNWPAAAGTYAIGDVFRISRLGSRAYVHKNDVLVFSGNYTDLTFSLVVDTAFYYLNGVLNAPRLSSDPLLLARTAARTFDETATLADGLNIGNSVALAETATLADTLTLGRTAARTFTEGVTLSDQVAKGPGRAFTEAANLSDVLTLGRAASRTLTESVSLSDSWIHDTGITLVDSTTLSDPTVTLGRTAARTLSETVTLGDTPELQKSGGVNPVETLSLTDVLTLGRTAARTLAETATLDDVLSASKNAGNYSKDLTETATLSHEVLNLAGIVLRESATLSDTFTTPGRNSKELTETVTLTDATVTTDQTPDHYTKQVTETVTLSDPELEVGVAPTETLTLSDTVTPAKSGSLILAETLTLADALIRGRTAARTLNESASLSDSVVRSAGLELLESAELTDTRDDAISRTISDAATLTDEIHRAAGRELVESLTLIDNRDAGAGRTLSEVISLSDTSILGLSAGRTLSETATLGDAIGTLHLHAGEFSAILSEYVALSDSAIFGRTAARTLTESVTLTDSVSKGREIVATESLTATAGIRKDTSRVVLRTVIGEQQSARTNSLNLRETTAISAVGQGIKSDDGQSLWYVELTLGRVSTPSGSLWVELHSYDAESLPLSVGPLVAQSETISAAALVASPASSAIRFNFSTMPVLTAGVDYVLVLEGDFPINGSAYVVVGETSAQYRTNVSPYSRWKRVDDSWLESNPWDLTFSLAYVEDFRVVLADILTLGLTAARTLSEVVSALDVVSNGTARELTDALAIADDLGKTPDKLQLESISLADQHPGFAVSIILADAISLSETLSRSGTPIPDTIALLGRRDVTHGMLGRRDVTLGMLGRRDVVISLTGQSTQRTKA